MPYPAQINPETIVRAARQKIEAEGVEQLSLGRLAAELGVKAPSLYRHVGNKTGLIQAVNTETLRQLFAALEAAYGEHRVETRVRLSQIAAAYRAFAHANPQTYLLLYASADPVLLPDQEWQVEMVLPLQILMADLSGEGASLAALRGLLALIHGFVSLELNQTLRRGGDLAADFEQVVDVYLEGWARGAAK